VDKVELEEDDDEYYDPKLYVPKTDWTPVYVKTKKPKARIYNSGKL